MMLVLESSMGVAVMIVAMGAAMVVDRERVWRVRRTEFDLQTRGSDLGSLLNVDML